MRLLLSVLLTTILPRAARAQESPSQSLWASLGAGGSGKGILLTASAAYSRGKGVVIGRIGDTGPHLGLEDKAILAGVRSGKGARFALAGVGIGRSRSTYKRATAGAYDKPRTVFAFQLQSQPDFDPTPLGITILGLAGPGDSSYVGAALSFDLGWFSEGAIW